MDRPALGLNHRITPAEPDAWNELVILARVPEGVGSLVILLGVERQTSATDLAGFDDVRLAKIRD